MTELTEQRIGISEIAGSAISDYSESEHKLRLVSTTALAVGTAAVNFAKIPLLPIPAIALEASHYTSGPAASGVATAAVFGGWAYLSSGIINAAGNHYPGTKERFSEAYPTAVSVFDSLPGLHASDKSTEGQPTSKRLRDYLTTRLKRGVTAAGVGEAVYMAAAQLDKKPKAEINRLRRLVATDAGLFIGSISCASTAVVEELGSSHPQFAEFVQEWATDPKLLAGLAVGIVATKAVKVVRNIRKTSVMAPTPEQDV